MAPQPVPPAAAAAPLPALVPVRPVLPPPALRLLKQDKDDSKDPIPQNQEPRLGPDPSSVVLFIRSPK